MKLGMFYCIWSNLKSKPYGVIRWTNFVYSGTAVDTASSKSDVEWTTLAKKESDRDKTRPKWVNCGLAVLWASQISPARSPYIRDGQKRSVPWLTCIFTKRFFCWKNNERYNLRWEIICNNLENIAFLRDNSSFCTKHPWKNCSVYFLRSLNLSVSPIIIYDGYSISLENFFCEFQAPLLQ